jgi:hypothetical protein
MACNIRPKGRYGLMKSGLSGLAPSEKRKTTLVFPFFPVGRAKFLHKRNLDAAHVSPGEICGLNFPFDYRLGRVEVGDQCVDAVGIGVKKL